MAIGIVGYFGNDLIIAGTKKTVDRIMEGIKKRFKCNVTELEGDNTRNILVIDVEMLIDGSITLTQEKYIEKLGEKIGTKAKKDTALNPHFTLKPWKSEINFSSSE